MTERHKNTLETLIKVNIGELLTAEELYNVDFLANKKLPLYEPGNTFNGDKKKSSSMCVWLRNSYMTIFQFKISLRSEQKVKLSF